MRENYRGTASKKGRLTVLNYTEFLCGLDGETRFGVSFFYLRTTARAMLREHTSSGCALGRRW